jgi:hypothetical protein
MIKRSLALSVLLFASSGAAKDGVLGGTSAGPVPLVETRVRMASEDIVLRYSDLRWHVEATYVFENPADAAIELQAGFPELRCEAGEECEGKGLRDVTTTVDGRRVTGQEGKLEETGSFSKYIGVIWLYDLTFPAKQRVTVVHGYTLSSGTDSQGNRFISHVTRAGRNWAGPIGKARFTARLPVVTHTIRRPELAGLRVTPPRVVSDGPAPHVEIVLEGANWVPAGDYSISFNPTALIAEARLDSSKSRKREQLFPAGSCLRSLAAVTRDCVNLIYASKGYPFREPELVKRFYSGDPHFRAVELEAAERYWIRDLRPFTGFSPDWFEAEERHVLKELQRRAAADVVLAPTQSAQTPDAATGAVPAPSLMAPPAVGPGAPAKSRCGCRVPGAPDDAGAQWLTFGFAACVASVRRLLRGRTTRRTEAARASYGHRRGSAAQASALLTELKPRKKLRCSRKNNTTIGTVVSTEAAIR